MKTQGEAMKSESLFAQTCRAKEVARRDWEAADARVQAITWNNHHYRAAVDARFEAAKRWTAASVEIRRYTELSESLARQIMERLWREAKDAQDVYLRAWDKYIVDGLEPVKALQVASAKATAAFVEASEEVMKYNKRLPLGDLRA